MKKILFFLLISSVYATAQVNNATNQPNFYEYLDTYSKANGDSIPDKPTQRMAKLWVPRLSPDGNLKKASNAIYNYAQNYSTYNSNTYSPNWNNLGPTGTNSIGQVQNGIIHNIIFDPNYGIENNKTIYACSSHGGLWRSENDGGLWSVVNTDVGIPLSNVADMAINPTDSNILFIASGIADGGVANYLSSNKLNPIFSIGVYRSTDYGATWKPINTGLESSLTDKNNIRNIEINPNNSNQIFIATEEGVFKTENANSAIPVWVEVLNGLNGNVDAEFKGIEFKPDNSNIVYASGEDIYKSLDNGNNWVSMTGSGTGLDLNNLPDNFQTNRINITTTPAAPERLYAYIQGNNDNGSHVYLYLFDGQLWSMLRSYHPISAIYAVHWTRLAIAAHPTNPDLVIFGDTQVWSIDVNTLFVTNLSGYKLGINQGIHADVHAIEFPPNDGSRFFCGTDGGISLKTGPFTNKNQWQAKNNGLSVSLLWIFDDSDYNAKYVLGGFQDNGTRRLLNNNDWDYIGGCDGYAAQINDTDDTNAFFISCGRLYRYNYVDNTKECEVLGRTTDSEVSYHCTAYSNGVCIDSTFTDYRPFRPSNNAYRLWLPNDFEIKTEPTSGDQYWTFTEIEKRKKKIPDTGDQTNPNNLWDLKSNISSFQPVEWRRQLTRFEISEANPNYRYTVNLNTFNCFNPPLTPVLYKVTDGSNNYSISNLPTDSVGDYPVISDIVIDPTNAQRIWISYTSFNAEYKVWLSEDAGETWTNEDPNHSLPNLPVNAITYQKGTNDILYVATDAGVYVKNGTNADWEKYGACPNVVVQDLKINYCSSKLRIATYGRGVWEADLLPFEKEIPDIVIDGTITWDTDVKRGMLNNIKIPNGATLILKGELSMPQEGKITIEKGGKLIIDGGKITQNCDGLWQGIEVYGSTNHPNDENYQGVLELKNGAIIEHAKKAIVLGKFGDSVLAFKPGGMLSMYNSTLKNNILGVQIFGIKGRPHINRVIINHNNFETDDYLYNQNQNGLDKYIFAAHARDVKVTNNNFQNNVDNSIVQGQEAMIYARGRGIGIYTYSSNILVNSNYFEKLYSGIQVTNSNYNAIDIKNNELYNNFNSIYLVNSNDVSITSNDIAMYEFLGDSYDCNSSGIYILSSKGFHIEDNDIYADSYTDCSNGIYIRDSRSSNTIYRNRFGWLDTAIYAEGDNTYENSYDGLEIQCNDFNNNKFDIYVAPEATIAYLQGGKETSAGNTFNPICQESNKEFNNQSGYQLYYFSEDSDEYIPNCNNNLNIYTAVSHNECPSRLDTSIIIGGGLVEVNNNINTNKGILANITDGGDTEALNETVEETETDEALILRNKLLEKSPFLSDTVMVKSTTKENILPAIMLKQVLAANPKSAKSNKVQKALDERQNKLPEYMRSEIDLGKNTLSYKEELESKLANNINLKENIIDRKIDKYIKDTISPTTAIVDLENLLINEAQIKVARNYDLVNFYLSKGDVQNAQTIFSQIPQNFDLTSKEQERHVKLEQIFNIKKDIILNEKSWFSINETELATINTLANDSISMAGIQARGILTLIENKDYGFPIPIKVNTVKNSYHALVVPTSKFEVEPEQAKNYFIIDYVLKPKENIDDVKFVIYDNIGNIVTDKTITKSQNQLIVECDKWKEGVYWCEKIVENISVEKKRVLILRDSMEEDISKLIDIYPNPTDTFININFGNYNYSGTTLQITNVRGSVIKTIELNNYDKVLKIDTTSWQSDTYFVSIINNEKIVETIKLVVK